MTPNPRPSPAPSQTWTIQKATDHRGKPYTFIDGPDTDLIEVAASRPLPAAGLRQRITKALSPRWDGCEWKLPSEEEAVGRVIAVLPAGLTVEKLAELIQTGADSPAAAFEIAEQELARLASAPNREEGE